MKLLTAALASLALIGLSQAQETKVMPNSKLMLSSEEIGMVAPALDKYTQAVCSVTCGNARGLALGIAASSHSPP
jgi:hypothetical protein